MPATRQAVAINSAAVELSRVLARGTSIYNQAFHRAYPLAESEFFSSTGLTLEHYFACTGIVALHFTNINPDNEHENGSIFHVHKSCENLRPEMAPVLERYFGVESQTADELRKALCKDRKGLIVPEETDPFNYLPLRERPILRAPDGRAIILDPVFYSEKSSVGPLFAIVRALRGAGRSNTVF